jgi:hypothetical protein
MAFVFTCSCRLVHVSGQTAGLLRGMLPSAFGFRTSGKIDGAYFLTTTLGGTTGAKRVAPPGLMSAFGRNSPTNPKETSGVSGASVHMQRKKGE